MTVAVLQMKAVRTCHDKEAVISTLKSIPKELLKAWQDKLTPISSLGFDSDHCQTYG